MSYHEVYMHRCIELAQMGKGNVAPNPMVGAVLVYDGRIIGEGWHRQYGQAHAEVNCLDSVREEDKQYIPHSTMYVSLEPCAHFGKTPPCANRLVQEKVKEVIICNVDPFEKVGGKGLQILKDNNIATATGVLESEGLWLNRRFYCFHQQKRPYIILKWAQTDKGYFAPLNRTRHQISNESSKQLVHKWRTEEAAIMVGYHTALNDDPQLTARLWQGRQPLRIVLDRNLNLPSSLRLFDAAAETWVINEKKDEQSGNVIYKQLDFANLLPALMAELHAANKLSLIVEGGAHLLNTFIEAGLWDEARIFIAANDLPEGIAAPVLNNATMVQQQEIGTDTLQLHINNASVYPFVNGMDF